MTIVYPFRKINQRTLFAEELIDCASPHLQKPALQLGSASVGIGHGYRSAEAFLQAGFEAFVARLLDMAVGHQTGDGPSVPGDRDIFVASVKDGNPTAVSPVMRGILSPTHAIDQQNIVGGPIQSRQPDSKSTVLVRV
jgi:hypothetical protein